MSENTSIMKNEELQKRTAVKQYFHDLISSKFDNDRCSDEFLFKDSKNSKRYWDEYKYNFLTEYLKEDGKDYV